MIILVDTNILLDLLQNREPHFESARRLWDLAERRILDGCVSAISFNNIYYIPRKQSGQSIAIQAIKLLRQIFRIVPLDEQIIDRAIASTHGDFEDAIQAVSALKIGADYIVSRNQRDFASYATPAVDAAEFLAISGL